MKTYTFAGRKVQAVDQVEGFFVDPKLPANFDDTDNEQRPASHQAWWNVPFIRTYRDTAPKFLEAWPGGVRYDVRCLDGGAWDRTTAWGWFATLDEAVECAKAGPQWRKSVAAVALGGRGGKAGKGSAKARTPEQARAAVVARWAKAQQAKVVGSSKNSQHGSHAK